MKFLGEILVGTFEVIFKVISAIFKVFFTFFSFLFKHLDVVDVDHIQSKGGPRLDPMNWKADKDGYVSSDGSSY